MLSYYDWESQHSWNVIFLNHDKNKLCYSTNILINGTNFQKQNLEKLCNLQYIFGLPNLSIKRLCDVVIHMLDYEEFG
jgi:hypothetical protein